MCTDFKFSASFFLCEKRIFSCATLKKWFNSVLKICPNFKFLLLTF